MTVGREAKMISAGIFILVSFEWSVNYNEAQARLVKSKKNSEGEEKDIFCLFCVLLD